MLGLERYPALLSLLRPLPQRSVALNVAQALVRRHLTISSAHHAELLLSLLAPLCRDVEGIDLDDEVRTKE